MRTFLESERALRAGSGIWRWTAAAAATAMLVLAALTSVRLYRADRLIRSGAETDLEKAVSLAPGNAEAWAQLGTVLERRGESGRAAEALVRAVRLNRYDAQAWVDLGLHREVAGDLKSAERCLLEATRVDSTFFPRWALANFYLRQGADDTFWATMRQALSRNYAAPDAAFELYWRATDNPQEILQKGVPDIPELNRKYFGFLVRTRRREPALQAWKRIANNLQPADLDLGLRYAEAALAEFDADGAMRVWNQLCQRGLLPLEPLDPQVGRVLSNGKFLMPPSGRAFDWTLKPPEGISADVRNPTGRAGVWVRFNGAHPETADLLWQLAPVVPDRTYQLEYRYDTSGLPSDTGLRWIVEDPRSHAILVTGDPLAATDEAWRQGQESFQVPGKTRLVRVLFRYERSPGTTRAQGSVSIADVTVLPASAGSRRARLSAGGKP